MYVRCMKMGSIVTNQPFALCLTQKVDVRSQALIPRTSRVTLEALSVRVTDIIGNIKLSCS